MSLLERWIQVKKNIARVASQCNRDPDSIELLVVSKGQSTETIATLAEAGQIHFGESYYQEAVKKIEALSECKMTWHFLGPVQSNKVKGIAKYFHALHSLDRLSIAESLERALAVQGKILNVFVQVNISHEPQKSGVDCDQVLSFVEKLQHYPHLNFQGLMGIGPASQKMQDTAASFAKLAELAHQLEQQGWACPQLSMGMSHDYELAIANGATWLRIGSAVFN